DTAAGRRAAGPELVCQRPGPDADGHRVPTALPDGHASSRPGPDGLRETALAANRETVRPGDEGGDRGAVRAVPQGPPGYRAQLHEAIQSSGGWTNHLGDVV